MIYVIVSILAGILLGLTIPYNLSSTAVSYVAVALLAALDSVFGGLVANFDRRFNISVFMIGLVANAFLAVMLTFVGNILGISLSFAVVIVFGVRIFNNLATIRRLTVDKYFEKRARERERERLLKLEESMDEKEDLYNEISPEAKGGDETAIEKIEKNDEITENNGENPKQSTTETK